MSHIPNSAMPHAGAQAEAETPEGEPLEADHSRSRFGQLADKVREHPKTAVAAGAAVAVGVAAAAAIPALRARGRSTAGSKAKAR